MFPWQLATILIDTNHNFIHQAVDLGIGPIPVCIQQVIAATASRTVRLGILLPAQIIVS